MYIAFDIGGTNIRISSYKELTPESFAQKIVLKSADNQSYTDALATFVKTIKDLVGNESVDGIGISMSGAIDPLEGRINQSDAFLDWSGKAFARDLGEVFNCTAKIENDAVTAGLAERVYGAGKNFTSIGFIIVGTGVGAVRIQNFQEKTLVFPTEFGHTIVIADGEKCVCGQRGCIEAYASGKGLHSFYGQEASTLDNKEAWVVLSRLMTQSLMNFLLLHPVKAFIFGGGLAINQKDFLVTLMKNVELMISKKSEFDIPEFFLSEFLDDAGSIGALGLLRDDLSIVNVKTL
jgi:glucokinase